MSYTVKAGDTLFSIAQSHGITLEALQAANPGVDPKKLQVGQVLKLPGGSNGGGSAPPSTGKGYVNYSGPASNFPNPNSWASWDNLWKENQRLMKFHDSDSEIALIKSSIETVAKSSGVDHRVILCIIVQESGGNVRVPTVSEISNKSPKCLTMLTPHQTNNGVRNPGLMQSHNGVEFNPNDPAGSILQMIRDGTEGTKDGDGLKQLKAKYGNYYEAFRAYNSGSVNKADLNDPVGATAGYVRDAANRLMGHVWDGM